MYTIFQLDISAIFEWSLDNKFMMTAYNWFCKWGLLGKL